MFWKQKDFGLFILSINRMAKVLVFLSPATCYLKKYWIINLYSVVTIHATMPLYSFCIFEIWRYIFHTMTHFIIISEQKPYFTVRAHDGISCLISQERRKKKCFAQNKLPANKVSYKVMFYSHFFECGKCGWYVDTSIFTNMFIRLAPYCTLLCSLSI